MGTKSKRVGDEARAVQLMNLERKRAAYAQNPNRCPQCDDPISWEDRKRKECCSRVCAGYKMRGKPFSKNNPRSCPRCKNPVTGGGIHCSKSCQVDEDWDERKKQIEEAGEVVGGSPHKIRKYLFAVRSRVCALCEITEWRGKPVPLIADHINGDPTDHRLVNLRLICPNCDAQLPTSKGRNRGNGRKKRRDRYAREKRQP